MLQQCERYPSILWDALQQLKQEDVFLKNHHRAAYWRDYRACGKVQGQSHILVKLATELCSQVECCIPEEDWEYLPSLSSPEALLISYMHGNY